MDFEELTVLQEHAVAQLASLDATLRRAELLNLIAGVRLSFAEQAEREVICDPRFAAEPEAVRATMLGAMAQSRAEAMARRVEAHAWLTEAPRQTALARALLTRTEQNDG